MPKGTFKPYLLCELFAHEKAGFPQINEESPPFFVYRIKSRFSVKRRNPNPSPTWKIKFGFLSFGPSDRIRTCGILLPKQARYQLRYTRLFSCFIRLGVFTQSRRATSCATPGYWVVLSGWAYSPNRRQIFLPALPDTVCPTTLPYSAYSGTLKSCQACRIRRNQTMRHRYTASIIAIKMSMEKHLSVKQKYYILFGRSCQSWSVCMFRQRLHKIFTKDLQCTFILEKYWLFFRAMV